MIYFDNGATTFPKPQEVRDAVMDFMENHGANPGRAGHRMALEAGRAVFYARYELSELFHIENPMNIAFTKNATEGLNMGILGYLEKGDHVISTMMEHNSVSRPIVSLENSGVNHTFVPCDEDGYMDIESFEKSFLPETKLVAITHASNLTGAVNDLVKIGAICKAHNVPLLVDAAQSAGVMDIDVEKMNIAILCGPGHKGLYGPMGTGFIYVREDIRLRPLIIGGTGSLSESLAHPDLMPDQLEAGTVNAVGIAGLMAGVKFVRAVGLDRIRQHEKELMARLIKGLLEIEGIQIYGGNRLDEKAAVVAFNYKEIPSTDIAQILDKDYDIAVRAGLHCSALGHQTLGTTAQGVVRVSFSYFNSLEEVDRFLEAVQTITKEFPRSQE